ncbi:unnamed protein product [Durusdinium trenchii]|uniref:Serine protease n=1 Tax=Durusdinium trenchii TaxID=1381693 RepID=A0ABP0QG55_9DINO
MLIFWTALWTLFLCGGVHGLDDDMGLEEEDRTGHHPHPRTRPARSGLQSKTSTSHRGAQKLAGAGDNDDDENGAQPETQSFGAAWNPAIYSALKYSIVRISTVDRGLDMDKPYEDAGIQESVGSGFLVDDNSTMQTGDDYTIVTNAHVVRGSDKVRVQFPSLGRHLFDATVPMICFQFDLAIVKLKDPLELKEKLKKADVTLLLLKLQARNVKMGMRVAALGFPLGSQWLKLSEGVVSGAEVVEDNMVYQSTAPISPGNSGGPLLVFRSLLRSADDETSKPMKPMLDTVVGVNFASSASKSAQNLNYAVPAFRIVQVLAAYAKMSRNQTISLEALDEFGRGTRQHMEFRIAPVGVVYTQATQAHLRRTGCRSGVPLDRFLPFSLFRWAEPPIPPGSFLLTVDETELDTFGMGKRFDFMQQYVSFKDLLTFRSHLDREVSVTTCMDGEKKQHRLSLKWNTSRFEGGIRYLYEPNFDQTAKDYEWFAGVTLVQLTLNHIDAWIGMMGGETLGRFYLEENTKEPRVAITSCASGFSCEEIVSTGMIVESLNGCPVTTLAEIRKCFEPKGETWQLVTDRGVTLNVDFMEELSQAVRLVREDLTLLSKAVRDAALKLSNGSSWGSENKTETNSSKVNSSEAEEKGINGTNASKISEDESDLKVQDGPTKMSVVVVAPHRRLMHHAGNESSSNAGKTAVGTIATHRNMQKKHKKHKKKHHVRSKRHLSPDGAREALPTGASKVDEGQNQTIGSRHVAPHVPLAPMDEATPSKATAKANKVRAKVQVGSFDSQHASMTAL